MALRKNANEASPPHIVVRKKHHDADHGHHGGTWKIAYADFMTAMMAFFLVMWLINTASKEKVTRLASYFNPVKLTARNPDKGIHEDEAGKPGKEKIVERTELSKASEPEKPKDEAKPETTKHQMAEEILLSDPFGVLTQLATKAEEKMAAETQAVPAPGSASHDPFITDPIANQAAHATTTTSTKHAVLKAQDAKANLGQNGQHAEDKTAPNATGPKPSDKTVEMAAQLEKELVRVLASLPKSFRPNITTKATSEGVLVSLTDDINFSMFKVASAEPSPQLVLVLERIGALINKQPGQLVVRGYTDGRQYANDAHGNWRLSVNRANMAYFMLLRAKVEDSRFLAVEGYADRNLRNKADPLAAENRRIEILIKSAEA